MWTIANNIDDRNVIALQHWSSQLPNILLINSIYNHFYIIGYYCYCCCCYYYKDYCRYNRCIVGVAIVAIAVVAAAVEGVVATVVADVIVFVVEVVGDAEVAAEARPAVDCSGWDFGGPEVG